MKTRAITYLILILLSSSYLFSQDDTHIKLYKFETAKEKKIKNNRFVNVTLDENHWLSGQIVSKTDSFLFITYNYETVIEENDSIRKITNYDVVDYDSESCVGLNLNDIDYIDYDTQVGWISASIGSLSLLTALIVAPLVSYGYKSGEFNSERYLNIMKYSLPTAAVGFSLYFAFGNRKFSVRPMN
jgi:hypothetical protein